MKECPKHPSCSCNYPYEASIPSTHPKRTVDELRGEVDRERQKREMLERALDESRKQILVLTMQCDQLKGVATNAGSAIRASRSHVRLPIDF